ncbi:MAG: hypothetical protein Sylvanvirus40_2 [Sylvanvirus sp.]|uniref:Uncharacterized protein n=1 Tax=Sylvanvirus sp. TaxID=2487774 RepID=A0A3G5ALL8_9VIRU|nr:MAG: hypothetical protein Sylvanvirus40_2 [Sylvanvirus sp.]
MSCDDFDMLCWQLPPDERPASLSGFELPWQDPGIQPHSVNDLHESSSVQQPWSTFPPLSLSSSIELKFPDPVHVLHNINNINSINSVSSVSQIPIISMSSSNHLVTSNVNSSVNNPPSSIIRSMKTSQVSQKKPIKVDFSDMLEVRLSLEQMGHWFMFLSQYGHRFQHAK